MKMNNVCIFHEYCWWNRYRGVCSIDNNLYVMSAYVYVCVCVCVRT